MKNATKKTPEQIEAEQAAYAAARATKAKQEAERKAAEKARREAAVDLMAARARSLAESNLASDRCSYVKYCIGKTWLDLQESLTERSARIAENPVNYFEWAEEDMKNAAKREILDRVIYCVFEKGKLLQTVLEEVKTELTEALLNNYNRPCSTSAAHNAMAIYKTDAVTTFLRYELNGWLRELAR